MGLVRFFLAFAVAAGHAAAFFHIDHQPIKLPGAYAVQIFYMISGFLIALILDGKYANSLRGNWMFYSNRAVKIFVPYLTVLAVTVAVSLVFYACTGDGLSLGAIIGEAHNMAPLTWLYVVFTNLFLFGLEWSYVLVDRGGQLSLDPHAFSSGAAATQFVVDLPAWTLSIELTFYLLAPLVLRRHFLLIAVLAYACQLFRFNEYHDGWFTEVTEGRFFPFELGLFLYGALVYRARRLLDAGATARGPLVVGFLMFLVLLPEYFIAQNYQLFAAVGLLLPSLLEFTNRHRWDRWLGELSYPLYILHFPLLWLISALLARWLPSALGGQIIWPFLALLAAIGLSAAMHHFIVVPVDRWRQARVGARRHIRLQPSRPAMIGTPAPEIAG